MLHILLHPNDIKWQFVQSSCWSSPPPRAQICWTASHRLISSLPWSLLQVPICGVPKLNWVFVYMDDIPIHHYILKSMLTSCSYQSLNSTKASIFFHKLSIRFLHSLKIAAPSSNVSYILKVKLYKHQGYLTACCNWYISNCGQGVTYFISRQQIGLNYLTSKWECGHKAEALGVLLRDRSDIFVV